MGRVSFILESHIAQLARLPAIYLGLTGSMNTVSKVGDQLVVDSKVTERLSNNFFIESMIPQYAENLKSLRRLKFDWARNDTNQDHVYANQALTHKLDEFGIPHEAEEYDGMWGHGLWGVSGRVYTEVLPFFKTHLIFAENASN